VARENSNNANACARGIGAWIIFFVRVIAVKSKMHRADAILMHFAATVNKQSLNLSGAKVECEKLTEC
jgi:hypothetical protein